MPPEYEQEDLKGGDQVEWRDWLSRQACLTKMVIMNKTWLRYSGRTKENESEAVHVDGMSIKRGIKKGCVAEQRKEEKD